MLSGSIVLLLGGFAIGWATGGKGLAEIFTFIVSPFKGVLCLFLMVMNFGAGSRLHDGSGRSGVWARAGQVAGTGRLHHPA